MILIRMKYPRCPRPHLQRTGTPATTMVDDPGSGLELQWLVQHAVLAEAG